ncbi:MAG: 3-deoxy-7-phosphoheptulonate synthase class II [Gammaproteobacteria bacterium]|nr:3-deoxy-7-phosphoheptulonate synthase class II [Gammaproteobacteria bacterium]
MKDWNPASWQTKQQSQMLEYPDTTQVEQVLAELKQLPPLVAKLEIDKLKKHLAACAKGESFLLQGGDCAESFADCRANNVSDKLKIILQMSLILLHGLKKPILRVGRIAGQYAKPRSASTETINGITLPSYRGDIINGNEFNEASRIPNPNRMREAYHYSALTLNYLRALLDGGFADLSHPEYWTIDFVRDTPLEHQYQDLVNTISGSIAFLRSIGGLQAGNLQQVDFYTSHEALHLPYEQALTHFDESSKHWYNLGTHYPWIGMRTLDENNAHVEYIRGIANPIAFKVSDKIDGAQLLTLLDILDPDNEPGRITLIHRMGAEKIAQSLPALIKAVQKSGRTVLWVCDPMHGNTKTTQDGIKTRYFEDILSELKQAFAIHSENCSFLGGVHLELTGENVTECIGGAGGLKESDLNRAYKSLVDPRLNYEQALEVAMLIAQG